MDKNIINRINNNENSSINSNYRICKRCIMDTTDLYIKFDANGYCNHCNTFEKKIKPRIFSKQKRKLYFNKQIDLIKSGSQGRKYNCIIGLSGGRDSSYAVYLAKEFGLNALVIHFDNGWDSELAINNIENIIKKTGFDYYNYIVDWDEFCDLQLSYLKASVVDVEIPTDLGIFSLLPRMANNFNAKYILFGENLETESIMGEGWNYKNKLDYINLKAIHKKYGEKELKSFPLLTQLKEIYYYNIMKIKQINILNYANCNYKEIEDLLKKEFKWRDYGVKHGESIFTKFYQSYVLPKKFNIDKRRAHLSSLICSLQITRDEALEIITKPVYNNDELKEEYEYIVKKLKLSSKKFEEIMSLPIKSHFDFPTMEKSKTYSFLNKLKRLKYLFLFDSK